MRGGRVQRKDKNYFLRRNGSGRETELDILTDFKSSIYLINTNNHHFKCNWIYDTMKKISCYFEVYNEDFNAF